MKKILSLILTIFLLICVSLGMFGCVSETTSETTSPPEVCLSHKGNLICEDCGLNYYEELKKIILKNGRPGVNAGVTIYDGKAADEYTTTFISYDMGTAEIEIVSIFSAPLVNDWITIISIPHPSDSDAIKNGKYPWLSGIDGSENGSMARGVVNANTFSQYTDSLTETVARGWPGGVPRSSFAGFVRDGIKCALLPLLQLGENGLTMTNLGFLNF